jgi:heme A synthase
MVNFYVALGMVAPFYNLALVVIVVWLFIVLFRTPSTTSFMKPWYLLFACVCLFILEETITILRAADILTFIPHHTNAFFEFGIITIFIYIVLIQKEYVKTHYI